MAIKPNYSLTERVDRKNRAFEAFFGASPENKPTAAQDFVNAAQGIFTALPPRHDTTLALMVNSSDIRTQTESILIMNRSNHAIRDVMKPLIERFDLRVN